MHTLGNTAIYLAAFSAVATIVLYWVGHGKERIARLTFHVTAASLVVAVATLLLLILTHRFDFHYVRSYSSTDLPLHYLIATFWGGQEGTLLLWMLYTSLLGLILVRTAGKYERGAMMTVSALIVTILAILIKRSPFALAAGPVATEGAGLNPLLQDFWMVIHPPVMFLGFALTAFPFAYAVSGLSQKDYTGWMPKALVWLLASWVVLFAALSKGGYWAYKVLGWGGFWAWDPVENSSMIPWLFASGGLHALIMVRKRKALGKTATFLCLMPLLAVLYGSFLTRSGVLADFSVHSFLDLGINNFLIAALGIFSFLGLGMFVWRSRRMTGDIAYHSMTVRDFFVTLAVLTLAVAGFLVAAGMSAPLLTRFSENPAAVNLDYYFFATTPIAFVLLISLAIFPFLKWQKPSTPFLNRNAVWSFLGALAVAFVAVLFGVREPLYIGLLFVAGFAVFANLWLVITKSSSRRLFNGGYVAHIGLAVLLVGAAISSAYEQKETIALPKGQTVHHKGFAFTYMGAMPELVDNIETPYVIKVEPESAPGKSFYAAPRMYLLDYNNSTMRKPHIKKYLTRDLYISPLDEVSGQQPGRVATFEPHQSGSVDNYTLTFLGFEMDEGEDMHDGGHGNRFAAIFEVQSEFQIDTVTPAMRSTMQGLVPEPVLLSDNQTMLSLEKINASDRTVDVRLVTPEHLAEAEAPVFWVEVAFKPLINLVWGGVIIMLIGGGETFWHRRRKSQKGKWDSGGDSSGSSELKPAESKIDMTPAQTVETPEQDSVLARRRNDGLASA